MRNSIRVPSSPTLSRADAAVAGIRNADIEWSGTLLGLQAEVRGERSKEVLAQGESAVPALLRALEDPERYVAAHVLLTKITKQYRLVRTPPGVEHAGQWWNGLRVTLYIDGRTVFDPAADVPVLRQRWLEWYRAETDARSSPHSAHPSGDAARQRWREWYDRAAIQKARARADPSRSGFRSASNFASPHSGHRPRLPRRS